MTDKWTQFIELIRDDGKEAAADMQQIKTENSDTGFLFKQREEGNSMAETGQDLIRKCVTFQAISPNSDHMSNSTKSAKRAQQVTVLTTKPAGPEFNPQDRCRRRKVLTSEDVL